MALSKEDFTPDQIRVLGQIASANEHGYSPLIFSKIWEVEAAVLKRLEAMTPEQREGQGIRFHKWSAIVWAQGEIDDLVTLRIPVDALGNPYIQ